MRKLKKWTAVLLAAFCVLSAASAAYADGPSGPASDTEAAADAQKKNAPSGPALDTAVQPDPSAAVQPDQNAAVQPDPSAADPNAAAQPDSNAGQGAPMPEQSTEGLVLSGGRYLDPDKPMVALTFDDGPYAPVGNRIMDSLELYNGRATFFVVGNRIPSYRAEILRMHNNGHEIGNHTYEHKYLNKLNAAQIRYQVEQCNQAVAAVTGEVPKLVRLPGGNKNNTVLANVNDPIIMWNIDTLDWKTRNAASTVQAVLGQVKDGDIVLMHELYSQSGDAAELIIPALAAQGYQLVTVSELAGFRGGVKNGGLYNSFRR